MNGKSWKELERAKVLTSLTSEDEKSLMYPDDMDNESLPLLIPVNGRALGTVKAMVSTAHFFDENRKK